MRICRSRSPSEDCPGAAIAIGNFDGVHLGHRVVIERTRALARSLGAPLGVLTFEPHPRSYFRPGEAAFRLTPFHPKARVLRDCGVDILFVRRFDAALATLTATAFAADIIATQLRVRAVVVGADFRFGHRRAGDSDLLARCGRERGYAVEVVAPVSSQDGTGYSSSTIRNHLRRGEPDLAAGLLGRWWEVEGHVRKGDQRGRTIGFPTANMTLRDYLQPAKGVYAVRVAGATGDPNVWADGVANLGTRPTVDGTRTLLEVHLLDFDGELYGRSLRVALIGYLRDERKFDGLAALKAQIAQDAAAARRLLAGVGSALGPA